MAKNREKHRFVYKFLKPILGSVFMFYYHPRIINKEVIPKDGPIIVVANHINVLDQSLAIMATKRMLHYMAKKEYFDGSHAWFFKSTGCISVNRAIHDQEAKDKALNVLKNGQALGLFPEGTRNKTADLLLPFKMGAVSMAQKTGATIVPYVITGKYKFFLKNKDDRLTATFLKPFKVSKDDNLEEVNNKLRNMMLKELERKNR